MRAIITKYVGPTATKPSRVIASDSEGNRATVTFHNAERDPHRDAAVALCRVMRWDGKLICGGIDKKGSVAWVFLPLDLMLAHKGRSASDVVDLSKTDEEISKERRIS